VTRRRSGLLGSAIAVLGLAVAVYLTTVKLAGQLPACGPLHGCETVALSEYSEIGGVPVALLGAAFSALVLGLQLTWWRTGSRSALLGAYGLGLFGILFVAYLTYLEIFVIHAICIWCVTYAAAIVAGWIIAALALRARPGSRADDGVPA
jgi:uncharacterized membrane protein